MARSKSTRTLTACLSELGLIPGGVPRGTRLGKHLWSDETRKCWDLLGDWLDENETRAAYSFDRVGTSEFEQRARSFVIKYGSIIWPASGTSPQRFAYPRNIDA